MKNNLQMFLIVGTLLVLLGGSVLVGNLGKSPASEDPDPQDEVSETAEAEKVEKAVENSPYIF